MLMFFSLSPKEELQHSFIPHHRFSTVDDLTPEIRLRAEHRKSFILLMENERGSEYNHLDTVRHLRKKLCRFAKLVEVKL